MKFHITFFANLNLYFFLIFFVKHFSMYIIIRFCHFVAFNIYCDIYIYIKKKQSFELKKYRVESYVYY